MNERPRQILLWALDTFGPLAGYRKERALRFIEEAIELVHAAGLHQGEIERVAVRVYGRPAGDMAREVGQAGMTLEALAENCNLSVDSEIDSEFSRVKLIPKSEWERRHNAKADIGIAERMASNHQ